MLGRPRLSTRRGPVYRNRMTESEKQARLAQALRANLRKRKAQSRAAATAAAEGNDDSDQIQAATKNAVDRASS